MKKYLIAIVLAIATVFTACIATSCKDKDGEGSASASESTSTNSESTSASTSNSESVSDSSVSSESAFESVEVKAVSAEVSVAIADLADFDFSDLFEIYVDGAKRYVDPTYIDASEVKNETGSYTVTCSYGGKTATVKVKVTLSRNVTVEATETRIKVKDTEVFVYDYKSYFKITEEGNSVEVTDDMLDLSALKAKGGTYVVKCIYDGVSDKIWVEVTETDYVISVTDSVVTVNVAKVKDLDLKALFAVTLNKEIVEVKDDMISGEVKEEVGDYTITLTIGSKSATVTVRVTDDHVIRIGSAYREIDLTTEDLASYDFTDDFYVYEDDKFIKVTTEMIDVSSLSGATSGNSYTVTLNYVAADGKGSGSASVTVNVVKVGSVVIKVKNAEIFDGENVDVRSLFEITEYGEAVEVTSDMISGSVSFEDGADSCEITLTYKGRVKVAVVKKITGVLVKYPHGESVEVKQGTDKDSYAFSDDFELYINGIRFYYIDGWIDTSEVDFTTAGRYTATLTVKYNDTTVGRKDPSFAATAIKTIEYVVIPRVYSIKLKSKTVEVGYGVAEYNPTDNISLVIDGYAPSFTANPSTAGSFNVYYKVISAADIMKYGKQRVIVDLYINGVDEEPVRVEYNFVVARGITIDAKTVAVISGGSLYTPDLFDIYENGVKVNVTLDMVSGRIDLNEPGIYELTVEYKGLVRTATVSVVPSEYVGEYETTDKTITKDAEYDDDGDVSSDAKPAIVFGDLIIGDDVSVNVHGKSAEEIILTDYGFDFKLGNNGQSIRFINGVVVIIPYNEIKSAYYDDNRPLVYFNKSKWTILDSITVNSSKSGKDVYNATYAGPYSIYLYKVKNKVDGETKWFGMKVKLDAIVSGGWANNWLYSVEYGFVDLSATLTSKDFGTTATVVLGSEVYEFKIALSGNAQINTASTDYPFADKTFTGVIDDKNATLKVGANEVPSLLIGGSYAFEFNSNTFSSKKYLPSSTADNSFVVYGYKKTIFNKKHNTTKVEFTNDFFDAAYENDDEKVTVTLFSYKFMLDLENNTFTLAEKDKYYGMFRSSNGRFIFLDGYGRGVIDTTGGRVGAYGIEYSVNGGEVVIDISNNTESLSVNTAEFFSDEFGNFLTVKDFGEEYPSGSVFEREQISGIAVYLNKTVYGAVSKSDIIANVRILTETGEYTANEKGKSFLSNGKTTYVVDTSAVGFKTSGFYKVTVNVPYDDGTKLYSKTFAIQILSDSFVGSSFVGNFGTSLSGRSAFTMDKYGVITFVFEGVTYTGLARNSTDKLFALVKANGMTDLSLTLRVDQDGILSVQAIRQALVLEENYCSGEVKYFGNDELLLRSFGTKAGNVFYVSATKSVLGEKVTLTTIGGEIVKKIEVGDVVCLTYGGKNYKFRLAAENNEKSGLEASDMLDGTYSEFAEGEGSLTLDGFGKAELNGEKYDYYVSVEKAAYIGLTLYDETNKIIRKVQVGISGEHAGTFKDFGAVTVDNLENKSFAVEKSVRADDYGGWNSEGGDDEQPGVITSRITLTFKANSVVTISFSCNSETADVPTYVGDGTFGVTYKTVEIKVNGYTITLEYDDPWSMSILKVKSITRPETYEEGDAKLTSSDSFKRV